MPLKSKIYFLTFILLLSCFAGDVLQAQTTQEESVLQPVAKDVMPESSMLPDVKMMVKTHPQKIVFTQFKLANESPDFDAFAKQSPFVIQAQDIDKSAMILAEYNRISNNFNLFNEKQNIVVHTLLNADEYSSMQNLIAFDELDATTFFRFAMYGYHVGIVPEDIAEFSRLQISPARAERMFAALDGKNQVMAEFILKPIYADRNQPFIKDDISYWLMFARIAEVRLWAGQKPDDPLVWYYRAPWYTPEANADLKQLYTE